MVIPTVPPQVPVLEDDDLPSAEDWAVLESLRPDSAEGDEDDRFIARVLSRDTLD